MTEQYHIRGRTTKEIAASVEALVARGTLSPGTQLPSVRRLAGDLGVSPTTAAAALRELARRGIVVSEERRGSTVSPRPPVATPPPAPLLPPGVRDLTTGDPDPALLPDLAAALGELEVPVRLYGGDPAVPELLELARADIASLGVPAEHLCVVSGALDGVERVLAAQLRPGDRVAVEDPGYPNALDLLRALGLVPVPVAIDDAGMLPDALARALAAGAGAVLVTPRSQNPTGAALDARRAAELRAALGRAPDVLVIEDDHLGAVAGVPAHTVVPGSARWAFVRSVAKSLGPDLRLAFIAGDAETVARVGGRLQLGPGWVSHVLQRLVLRLLRDPAVAALRERAARTYQARRDALIAALAAHGVAAHGRTGMNVWIPVPDEATAVRALLQEGWAVRPGAEYRLESPPAIRVTTAALEPEEAERLAEALARALEPGRRTRAA